MGDALPRSDTGGVRVYQARFSSCFFQEFPPKLRKASSLGLENQSEMVLCLIRMELPHGWKFHLGNGASTRKRTALHRLIALQLTDHALVFRIPPPPPPP